MYVCPVYNIFIKFINLIFYIFYLRSVGDMDSTGSVSAVEGALERLGKQRGELEEMWAARKLRLDLCLRLRLFERDALEVSLIFPKKSFCYS